MPGLCLRFAAQKILLVVAFYVKSVYTEYNFHRRRDSMKKLLIAALLVCTLLLALAGCSGNSQWPSNTRVKELTVVVDETTIIKLNDYTRLEKVDLTGSTCYSRMAAYAASHPEIQVIYTVAVGTGSISTQDTDAVLAGGTYEFDKLVENLQYLPGLKSLKLQDCTLNPVQLDALRLA